MRQLGLSDRNGEREPNETVVRTESAPTERSVAYSISRSQISAVLLIALVFGITFCLLLSAQYQEVLGHGLSFTY